MYTRHMCMRSFDIINTMQQMQISIHFNFTSSPILILAPVFIRTSNVWVWPPIVAIITAVLPFCIVIRCHWERVNCSNNIIYTPHHPITSSPILISAPPFIRTLNVSVWPPIAAIITAVLPCCIVIRCHWERVNCSNNIIYTVLQCNITARGSHMYISPPNAC